MSAPAVVLATVLANPVLPWIDMAAQPYVPEFELDASDHWLFDKGDASGLVGRVSGSALTPNAGATGVKSAAISNGGSSYATAPAVSITGGGGSGATATCVVSGGVVTKVRITNPGSGYTSDPAIGFSGGGGTGAAATSARDGTPTYSAKYLTTPDGGVNGLLTPFTDAAVQTVFGVFRRDTISDTGQIFFGSATSNSGEGGSQAYQNSAGFTALTRGIGSTGDMSNGTLAAASIDVGDFFFLAISQSLTERRFLASPASAVVTSGAKTASTLSKKVTIGNGAYAPANVAWQQGVSAAEFAVYSGRALTAAELSQVYARSKIRMARRGITIV